MAIGGVTCVTRNIYGWRGACQDMQSDVHCLRFSAVPDAVLVGYAMQMSMKGMAIKGNTALSHRASGCFVLAMSRAREPVALQTSRLPTMPCTQMRLSEQLLVDSPKGSKHTLPLITLYLDLSYIARSWNSRSDVFIMCSDAPPQSGCRCRWKKACVCLTTRIQRV